MSRWNRLLELLGLHPAPDPQRFELDEDLRTQLVDLAQKEQRPARELQNDLLTSGLSQHHSHIDLWQRWQSLSPREQDVAALTCLGYTNRQIAARLKLAPDTVKGYVRQTLVKFNLHSKAELRLHLAGWDFSLWGSAQR